MSLDQLKEYWQDLRENWDDAYWRADHPEVIAVVVAFLTGIIGLMFAVLQALVQRRLIPDG